MSEIKKKDQLDVVLLEMKSTESPQNNLDQILELTSKISKENAPDWICLPENSLYNKVANTSTGLPIDAPEIIELSKLSRKLNSCIHLGAIPLFEEGLVYNASVLIVPDRPKPIVAYKKIHLFDLNLEKLVIKESDEFAPGYQPAIFTHQGWKFGFSICYDLRFPELFYYYCQQNVDVIFTPAAFTVPTGKAHWDYLTTTRAIECQSFVVAAGQTGTVEKEGKKRSSYGHSAIIDPWGEKLCLSSDTVPSFHRTVLKKERIEQIRRSLPIREHRQFDLELPELNSNKPNIFS